MVVTGSERASSEEDYYRIWDRLPEETRDYVPLMIAAARIAKDPGRYGFQHVVPLEAQEYDEVKAAPNTELSRIAAAAGVDADALAELNPFLKGKRSPTIDGYQIRVPRGSAERVAAALGGGRAPGESATRAAN